MLISSSIRSGMRSMASLDGMGVGATIIAPAVLGGDEVR